MNTPGDRTRNKKRVVVVDVRPEIDGGRFPIKRVIGDQVQVTATVVADGHDVLSCSLRVRAQGDEQAAEISMVPGLNDTWTAEFGVEKMGRTSYTVEGWINHFATWRRDFQKRLAAKQDVRMDLQMGAVLVTEAGERATGADARTLARYAGLLADRDMPDDERAQLATSDDLLHLMNAHPDRSASTAYGKELSIVVDPLRARFGSWYELFPRSVSPDPQTHGTLKSCEAALPSIAAMGFDIVYLPPIHPIGAAHRKGPNNSAEAAAADVGSPWAIGNDAGGHTAVHPQLGTLDDFRHFLEAAKQTGLDVALDIAFQCSPDHPYVREHPEWFRARPDGTIQYAENPPKKYEDIYPFNFDTPAWEPLWNELRDVVKFWMDQGVRVFRVDNPHTKPLSFWEWLINDIKAQNPEVIFLAEAFTRPALMYQLAKVGFSQSYNYFPWKNTKAELETYFTELSHSGVREYFRCNLWPNTPDILTDYLQHGGRAGFVIRFLLAATLGANYGIYGPAFELCEDQAKEPGSEEYLHSEKYEIKHWDVDQPGNLRALITRTNQIRRAHPALQRDDTLAFHACANEQLLCFSKRDDGRNDAVVVVVNVDPRHKQAGEIVLPLEDFKIDATKPFRVRDLLTGICYLWQGPRHVVELDPNVLPAHVFSLEQ
jgi:starch synthase (maltosyl-transferring)